MLKIFKHKCPKCGKKDSVGKMCYGYGDGGERQMADLVACYGKDSKQVKRFEEKCIRWSRDYVNGGCCVDEFAKWYCRDCDVYFNNKGDYYSPREELRKYLGL